MTPSRTTVKPSCGHALRLGRRENVAAGAVDLDLVGRDLVHEIDAVEQDGPPSRSTRHGTAGGPERPHRPVRGDSPTPRM